jgi:hypothetical protein
MELSPHSLTATLYHLGIRSLIGFARLLPVETFQCSTPKGTRDASPKAISERTSYYQVRLAFHSYHKSSEALYNSTGSVLHHLSTNFTLLMGSSPGFGSYAYYNFRAINTRFPYGSILSSLACSMHKLVGSFFNRHAVTEMQNKACPLRLLVSIWFQVYFTALTGLLFTFPSRY